MQSKSFFNLKAATGALVQRWMHGWSELRDMPILRRLLPAVKVSLLRAEQPPLTVTVPGFETEAQRPDRAAAKHEEFAAVLLPESAFLQRHIHIPVMSIAESRSAMQLEVEAASPFPPEQTVWGWRSLPARSGFFVADIVITSRPLVESSIAALSSPPVQPEIWAPLQEKYAVIEGFGEGKRLRRQRNQMLYFALMLGIVALLALTLVATPLVQKRSDVIRALQYQTSLMERSGNVNWLREQLSTLFALHETLGPRLDNEPHVAALLDKLSAVFPDGSWLTYFEYNPSTLRLAGYADDAIALQRKLQEQPGFANVRATAPIARDARINKDRFTFDLELRL